jgi:hypothetical protein
MANPAILTSRSLRSIPGPLIIYNDTRGRLPELYSASDLAIVFGANNFFEPLIAKCPTLLCPGRGADLDYSPGAYAQLAETALATRGAAIFFADQSVEALHQSYRLLLQIRPEDLAHPAFVRPASNPLSGFNDLLDDLEEKIRIQVYSKWRSIH